MVFSSWQFILVFLPLSFFVYFWLNKYRLIIAGKVWLVLASGAFYAYWNVAYLPLMVGSILFNFAVGNTLARSPSSGRKVLLAFGIAANLLLLGYYKYTGFLLQNVNALWGVQLNVAAIALPLAISFFTFTQIVYLVDSYRKETAEYNLLNYALFVTFFPHLIAGPIVHHRQIMPQFASRWTLIPRYRNILLGLCFFAVGLFKKVVIADTFADWADAGFDGKHTLGFFAAWAASLSYTFQIYFDFSGYCDMAVGASLLFNIWLPLNFNSPYQSLSIQDFWRRWHITLSSFLRDYLYVPLGGNRGKPSRTYINLLITFLLGGLWHGATWMFVIWGALHGCALVIHRLWSGLQRPLPKPLAWLLTFVFVNITWVFFRANSLEDAARVLQGMVSFESIFALSGANAPTADLAWGGWMSDVFLQVLPAGVVGHIPAFLAIAGAFVLIWQKNFFHTVSTGLQNRHIAFCALLFSVALCATLVSTSTVFLYFNF